MMAHRMVTLLRRPASADVLDDVARTAGLELVLEDVHLPPRAPFLGHPLATAQGRAAGSAWSSWPTTVRTDP